MYPNAHAGDDPEHALRADQQLSKVGARGRLRCAAEIEHTRRCHRAQPAHHVVEAAVTRGVLAGRPRRGEPADGRELKALREVAEGVAALAKETFGLRSGQSRAQLGFPGHLVEGVQLVQPPQIQRHHGLEVAANRIKAADHAGAAAERDDRDAVVRAVSQDRGDLFFAAGQQHRVGCVLHAGILAAQQVQRGLAASTHQPGAVVDAAVLGADDRRQPLAIGDPTAPTAAAEPARARGPAVVASSTSERLLEQ